MSTFPEDPALDDFDLGVLFTNAAEFHLFDVPRTFVCGVACTLSGARREGARSRFLFLFEDVLLVTKPDERRRWDEGAYLIIARLDLVDVHVRTEDPCTFCLNIEGIGNQTLHMRDAAHTEAFLNKLRVTRNARRAQLTPRSDEDPSSAIEAPKESARALVEASPQDAGQTRWNAEMDRDFSEEVEDRIERLAQLVDVVSAAYGPGGSVTKHDTYVMLLRRDREAMLLALTALQQSAVGTPLDSPALRAATTLADAQAVLSRTLADGSARSANTAVEVAAAPRSMQPSAAELERAAALERDKSALQRDNATLQRDNATLQRELASARQQQQQQQTESSQQARAASEKSDAEARAFRASLSAAVAREQELQRQIEAANARAQEAQRVYHAQVDAAAARDAQAKAETRALHEQLEAQRQRADEAQTRSVVVGAAEQSLTATPGGAAPRATPESASSLGEFSIDGDDLDAILSGFAAVTPQMRRAAPVAEKTAAAPTTEMERALAAEVHLLATEVLGARDAATSDAVQQLRAVRNALSLQRVAARAESLRLQDALNEAAALRKELRAAQSETRAVAVTAAAPAAAAATNEKHEAELAAAQRQVRRLETELAETQASLRTAKAIAEDSQNRARQERNKSATVGSAVLGREEAALNTAQARATAEQVRVAHHRHHELRLQVLASDAVGTLTSAEARALLEQQSRELESMLSTLDVQLGGSGSSGSIKSPRNTSSSAMPGAVTREGSSPGVDVRVQSLKLENARMEQELQDARSELAEVRGQVKVLQLARTDAEALAAAAKAKAGELEERLAAAQAAAAKSATAADAANVEKAALAAQVATLGVQVANAREDQQSLQRATKQVEQLKADVLREQERVAAANERIEKLEAAVTRAVAECKREAEKSSAANKRVEALEADLKRFTVDVSRDHAAALKRAEALEADAKREASKAASAQQRVTALEVELLRERERVASAERSAATALAEAAEAQAVRSAAAVAPTLAAPHTASHAEELAAALKDLQDAEEEREGLEKQLAAALGRENKLKTEKKELQARCDKLSGTVKELLKHSNEQAQELQSERSLNQSMQSSRSTSPPPMSPSLGRVPATPSSLSGTLASTPGGLSDTLVSTPGSSFAMTPGPNADLLERLEEAERKVKNLQETNKALIGRLNEVNRAAKKK